MLCEVALIKTLPDADTHCETACHSLSPGLVLIYASLCSPITFGFIGVRVLMLTGNRVTSHFAGSI